MDKRINILKMLFGVLTMLLFLVAIPETVSAATEIVGDYEYNVSNGIATVAKYTGNEANIIVPTEVTINGMRYKISKIEASAFANNTTMTSLVIPEGITNVGNCAFKNCTALTSITIEGDIADCSSKSTSYGNSSSSVFYNAGANADSLTVTFTEGVTKVPAYLFATYADTSGTYARVTKVNFANTVTDIGMAAFYHCIELKDIEIGKIKTIGNDAFAHCYSIKKLVLPSQLTTIGERAFDTCMALESLSLPEADCIIKGAAFKNCTALSAITVNGNIADCSSNSASYGNSSYSVFYNAGANADSLTVNFAEGVTKVPAYLFATYADTSGTYARVTKVNFADTVTDIGMAAFYHCIKLKDIEFGKIKTIGNDAFAHCYSVKKLVLPSQLTTIGERAFDACETLESLSLPKADCTIKGAAFKNCTALSAITVNGNIADCSSKSASYGNSSYSVFYNAGANTDSLTVNFAEGVTKVPAYLFATYVDSNKTYARITNVTLPETINEIGQYAFYNCAALKEITILDSVETIGKGAFDQCGEGFYISLYDNSAAHDYVLANGYDYAFLSWNGWRTRNGQMYWYEKGIVQGREGRGKEIYDAGTDAWYWLDAVQGGAKAVSKDVYQESSGGKWVRYDADGHMIKGWQETEAGTYYFDLITGAMYKGIHNIDGTDYYFNETTGIEGAMYPDGWNEIDGVSYWYENGVRQGYDPENPDYRGKEIYDPGSDAWYWLDNVQQGAKAVSKDVYQESISAYPDREDGTGKWVRYDANGHMVKGWQTTEAGTCYFEKITGAMAKGSVIIDGIEYYFDPVTGIRQD